MPHTLDRAALHARWTAAQGVARAAGAVMARRFRDRSSFSTSFKGHQDYLTEVDGEIERLVVAELGRAFPGDAFMGEEGGGVVADRLWVIDPIDGTANFARGIPHFCISIGFMVGGQATIGVVYDPSRDEMFTAMTGAGAWLDGEPMCVSGTQDIRRANVEVGWSSRLPMNDYLAVCHKVADLGAGLYRSGSGSLGVAYVAAGRLDGYVELHINAWDVLAGLVLVAEAGGALNPFLAGEGLTRGNPILAATPALAMALSQASGIALD